MKGTARLNLEVFQELCGNESLSNVILASTMWDLVSEATGQERETQLKNEPTFWATMVAQGSQVERHNRSQESALYIISRILHNRPTVLHVQDEIVNRGLNLDDTDCGRTLQREFAAQRFDLESKLRNLEEEKNKSIKKAVARYEDLSKQLKELTTADAKLREDTKAKIAARESEFRGRVEEVQKNANWWQNTALATAGVGLIAIAAGGKALMSANAGVILANEATKMAQEAARRAASTAASTAANIPAGKASGFGIRSMLAAGGLAGGVGAWLASAYTAATAAPVVAPAVTYVVTYTPYLLLLL